MLRFVSLACGQLRNMADSWLWRENQAREQFVERFLRKFILLERLLMSIGGYLDKSNLIFMED